MPTAHSFNIWRAIDRLNKEYSIDRELVLQGTNIKRGSELTAFDLLQISKNLKVDCKNLLTANLDLEVLSAHLKGENLQIPDKYLKGMFSSSTSLKNTVNQFKRFGMKEYILKKLQIDETYLNEHRGISVLAVNDALKEAELFLTDSDLQNYSRANANDFYTSEFGKYVRENMSKNNVIDTIIDFVHLVEQNWSYKIISRNILGQYVISTSQSKRMNDLNLGITFTTPTINKMRIYFFYYFLELCGFSGQKVEIISQNFDSNSTMLFSIQL